MQKKRKPKRKVGRKGRPIKIPADFDTAIDGLLAIPEPQNKPKKKEETHET
jgi:hypothetical protein